MSIVINFFNNAFCPFQKYDINGNCTLTIGNDRSNTFCYQNMNLVSRKHAIIRKKQNELIVEDCSSNGCFVNGKRIHNQGYLNYGDTLEIFGLKIMYFKEFLGVRSLNDSLIVQEGKLREYKERKTIGETINANSHGSEKVFRRAPRNIIQLLNNRIELEAPPTRRELRTRPALLTIGPSITMALPMLLGCILAIYGSQMNDGSAGVFMYTGIVTAVASALIGTFWTILNMRYEKKRARKEEEIRRKSYTEYLEEKEREIKELYEQNSDALRERYPDTLKCCGYDVDSCELWNRNHSHGDFLSERLGVGELPFPVDVEIPKNRFSMIDDELKSKPKHIFERYKYMKEVPICVDLMAHRIIGIIGNRQENACYNVLNTLVAQIAANNCYVDVKLAFVFKQEENEGRKTLEYARWLPHVWSGDKKWRYVASEKQERSEILYELVKILRSRVGEGIQSRNKQVRKPHYVLIVDGPELLEGELISKYVFDTTVDYGLTTIFLTESYEELPNSCEYVVENTEYFQGAYTVSADVEAKGYIDFDYVDPQVLENFSRRLSSIVVNEVERGDEIPSRLDFLEMYGVKSVEEFRIADRWRKNRTYENIKALIGEKTGETPCFLDIHE
ncbi:MAG: FHA domain-containing protein, partial [bacterium]|nr:FHA domain-containing protein [bacterium]